MKNYELSEEEISQGYVDPSDVFDTLSSWEKEEMMEDDGWNDCSMCCCVDLDDLSNNEVKEMFENRFGVTEDLKDLAYRYHRGEFPLKKIISEIGIDEVQRVINDLR